MCHKKYYDKVKGNQLDTKKVAALTTTLVRDTRFGRKVMSFSSQLHVRRNELLIQTFEPDR